LATRPTLLPPITDVSDESETDPTLLDIEPVDPRLGGYTWTAVDGSVWKTFINYRIEKEQKQLYGRNAAYSTVTDYAQAP